MSKQARTRFVRSTVRVAISALFLAIFVLHVSGQPRFEIIDRIENYLYDVRIRLTMPATVDDRIVIIDIDEQSQQILGQWPWPRRTLAELIDRLFDDYGVKVLGLDVLFAEAEESSAGRLLDELMESDLGASPEARSTLEQLKTDLDGNVTFAEALIARDVVTGFVFKDSLANDEPVETGVLPPPIMVGDSIDHLDVPFITAVGFTGTLRELQENAIAGGFFDSPLIDSDGVFRRAPLVQRYEGDLYPSLALAIAHVALGSPPVGLVFAENDGSYRGVDVEAFQLGDAQIPVSEQIAVFIPYRGPQESFPFVSAVDVLSGDVAAELLRDRIALLGASAAGLLDLRSTPVGQRYAGVEAHANLVAGLLDNSIRRQPAYANGIELFTLLVVALLTSLVMPRLAPFTALVFTAGLLAIGMTVNLWLWSAHMLVVPLASLIAYTLIAALFQITYGFFIESRNKRRLSDIFGQYIPPRLVEEMDEEGVDVSLEGETREMSVLFSDVRSFTTISEGLDARELTQMMNEFLTPFTGAIQRHRGTIDKYMGDCVMAFWGAPLADADHARHALFSGFDMLAAVHDLDNAFEARGWPKIRVGVGIASGNMNVGNMGSKFRVAYTVMGDTVNLGSRLEGLTKQYGVDIIVSDRTRELVTDFTFRTLDLVRVKGKTEPVAIHEPLGPTSALDARQRDALLHYETALTAYRRQDWDTAERIFRELLADEERLVYSIYIDRIGAFRTAPPPTDWDGVFEHLVK